MYDRKLMNKIFDIKERLNDEDKMIVEQMMSYMNRLYIKLTNMNNLQDEVNDLLDKIDELSDENERLRRENEEIKLMGTQVVYERRIHTLQKRIQRISKTKKTYKKPKIIKGQITFGDNV